MFKLSSLKVSNILIIYRVIYTCINESSLSTYFQKLFIHYGKGLVIRHMNAKHKSPTCLATRRGCYITPTNLISHDGERKTSTCYDVRSSNVIDKSE